MLQSGILCKSAGLYIKSSEWASKYLMPILVLFMRLYMARIFWYSGLTKVGSWDATLYLFQYEYNVPFIPPDLGAVFATAIELSCPILLTFGILTRLATLPMLAMTAVIQFVNADTNVNIFWATILGTILCYGPGKFSIDYLISKRLSRKNMAS